MACSSPDKPDIFSIVFRFIAPSWQRGSSKWLKSTASALYLQIGFYFSYFQIRPRGVKVN